MSRLLFCLIWRCEDSPARAFGWEISSLMALTIDTVIQPGGEWESLQILAQIVLYSGTLEPLNPFLAQNQSSITCSRSNYLIIINKAYLECSRRFVHYVWLFELGHQSLFQPTCHSFARDHHLMSYMPILNEVNISAKSSLIFSGNSSLKLSY